MDTLFISPNLWLLIGSVCMFIEVAGASGMGFFFGGLAGYLIGMLVYFNIIPVENMTLQWGAWFLISAALGAALWKPLRALNKPDNAAQAGYSTTIQGEAIIIKKDLHVGEMGHATWSGTIMNAKLAPHQHTSLAKDTTARIVGVQGNVLLLESPAPAS